MNSEEARKLGLEMLAYILSPEGQKEFKAMEDDVMAMPYDRYLSGKLWGKIRRRVQKRDNRTCRRCGRRATQVHHVVYTREVLEGNDDTKLVSLCRNCHEYVGTDDQGRNRPEAEQWVRLADYNSQNH